MWITMIREANYEPLWPDLGFGYTGQTGYYVFTDPGEGRIERAALGVSGPLLERSGGMPPKPQVEVDRHPYRSFSTFPFRWGHRFARWYSRLFAVGVLLLILLLTVLRPLFG